MMDVGLKITGSCNEETVIIGDSLKSDISMAISNNCPYIHIDSKNCVNQRDVLKQLKEMI